MPSWCCALGLHMGLQPACGCFISCLLASVARIASSNSEHCRRSAAELRNSVHAAKQAQSVAQRTFSQTDETAKQALWRVTSRCAAADPAIARPLMTAFKFDLSQQKLVEKCAAALSLLLAPYKDVLLIRSMADAPQCAPSRRLPAMECSHAAMSLAMRWHRLQRYNLSNVILVQVLPCLRADALVLQGDASKERAGRKRAPLAIGQHCP